MEYLGDGVQASGSDWSERSWTQTGDLPRLSLDSVGWLQALRGVQFAPTPDQRENDQGRPPLLNLYESVPLHTGLNAVYGLNGAGKTRFLRRLGTLLDGDHGPEEGFILDPRHFFRLAQSTRKPEAADGAANSNDWMLDGDDWASDLAGQIAERLSGQWWISRPPDLVGAGEEPSALLAVEPRGTANTLFEMGDSDIRLLADVLRHGQLLLTRPFGTNERLGLIVPFLPPGVRPPRVSAEVTRLRNSIVAMARELAPLIAAMDDDVLWQSADVKFQAERDRLWPSLAALWLQSPLANCRNLVWWDTETVDSVLEVMSPRDVFEFIEANEALTLSAEDASWLLLGPTVPLFLPPIAVAAIPGWTVKSNSIAFSLERYLVEPASDVAGKAIGITREHLWHSGDSFRDDDPATAIAADAGTLQSHASDLYERFLPGSAPLRLEMGGPREWLRGSRPKWYAGQRTDLAEGSLAQQRWAYLAIARAVSPSTPFVILDEPEAGLHRTAEAAMAANLASRDLFGDAVIVAATHSPEILDQPEANLLFARAYEPLRAMSEEDRAFPEFLGLRRSDLLAGTRVLLLVEGEHDRVVLRHLLGKALDQLGVHILALRGAKNASAVVDSQFLFDFSDATMVVLLDNLKAKTLQDVWSRARGLTDEGKRTEAWKSIEATIKDKDGEAKFIRDFMSRALEQHLYDRVEVFALHEPDVIYYLPHDKFTGSDPWSKVKRDYSKYRSHSKTAKSLKNWIAERYGTPANSTELVAEAVAEMDLPPAEFVGLLSFLQGIVRGQ